MKQYAISIKTVNKETIKHRKKNERKKILPAHLGYILIYQTAIY
jgi:hypothetical protein